MRLESWGSIAPIAYNSNFLCARHDCSASKANIAEGDIAKYSSTPLAGDLITKSGLGFSIWNGSETEGFDTGGWLDDSVSLPVIGLLDP